MNFNFLQEQVVTGESQVYLDWLFSGLQYTISLTIIGFAIALLLGTLIGVIKNTQGIAGKFAQGFFEVNRSIPLLAQVFIAYFVIPDIFPEITKHVSANTYSFISGVISLGIYMSGRVASQVSAGLQALPINQKQACYAMGMSPFHTYTLVLLPQVFKNIFPSLTSEAMNTTKNSAVVGTIGLLELSKEAQRIIDYTSMAYEVFLISVAGYILINLTILLISKIITRKARI